MALRNYNVVRLLAASHAVTFLAYGEPGDLKNTGALEAVCESVRIIARPPSTLRKRALQLSSVLSPWSFQWMNMHSAEMQRALDDLCGGVPFDVIQVESSQLAAFRFDRRSVLVLDEHNLEYELLFRMYQTERSTIRRFYNWIEYAKFRREELRLWRRVDGCVTTSRREEAILRQTVPGVPAVTVPNAVDIEYFRPAEQPVRQDMIVFTGQMGYRPNVDGAVFFVNEVLPRILAVRRNAVFFIVGADPAPEVRQLASDHVIVTGRVPDVRPFVHEATAFVVPLRMGGGTRLKVLEGLAMRKAMVSTALGCEGIDVVDGEHLLIRDEAGAFARAVIRILEDPNLATELGARARQLAESRYRWESVVADLERFHLQLVQRRSAAMVVDRAHRRS